jgi:hypothetical protein
LVQPLVLQLVQRWGESEALAAWYRASWCCHCRARLSALESEPLSARLSGQRSALQWAQPLGPPLALLSVPQLARQSGRRWAQQWEPRSVPPSGQRWALQ